MNNSGNAADGTMGGVLFTVEATYNGKPVKPGIVMTSGEDISAGKLEAEIYTTNGTPWDLAGVIGGPRGTKQYIPTPDFKNMNEKDKIAVWNSPEIVKAVEAGMFATRDAATAGLGSQVFGSYSNGGNYATPIVSTANVSEVGFYILASGQQSSMIGIKFSDFGDLPESYGNAEHYLLSLIHI